MRFRLFAAALAAAVLTACGGSSPTASENTNKWIVVSSPKEGQTFTVEDPVTIAWTCQGCEGLKAHTVVVYLDVGEHIEKIDDGFLSGSLQWQAGRTLGGGLYSDGFYRIIIRSETIWDSSTGYIEAGGGSGTFRIVNE